MSTRNLDLTWRVLSILFQAYLICWMLTDVKAQYDYENEGAIESSGQGSRGQQPIQLSDGRIPWEHPDQVILEKCMQLQRMAVRKRNFGLEIPDIIMNRVQGGTDGSPNLKELRMRMVASGRRK